MLCKKLIVFPRGKTYKKYSDLSFGNVLIKANQNYAIKILTRREMQVLILSGRAKSLVEIGIILGISNRTAGTFRGKIMKKMNMENVYQIMEYCIRADMDKDEFMDQWLPVKSKSR